MYIVQLSSDVMAHESEWVDYSSQLSLQALRLTLFLSVSVWKENLREREHL